MYHCKTEEEKEKKQTEKAKPNKKYCSYYTIRLMRFEITITEIGACKIDHDSFSPPVNMDTVN